MSAPSLDDIARHLENQRTQTEAKASQMQDALSAILEELARLDGAIAALRGTPSAGPSGSPTKKAAVKRKAAAPAASRDKVAELMTSTLRHHGVMQEEKLKVAVENQLIAAGYSRMGYALRFNEVMADVRFISTKEGVTLRRRTNVSGSPAESPVADDDSHQVENPRVHERTLHTSTDNSKQTSRWRPLELNGRI